MAESVAGFILRFQDRNRTKELFKQTQKKNTQDLLNYEEAKQAQREKMARLKALRLDKKKSDLNKLTSLARQLSGSDTSGLFSGR